MTSLIQRARGITEARSISTVDDYITALQSFYYQGNMYGLGGLGLQQTDEGQRVEPIANDMVGYATAGYMGSGPVFSCMSVRMAVFAGARFTWQRLERSRPSELFGTQELSILEQPWIGGTTQDLLSATILDNDLAGNAYWTNITGELVRLRPDWVQVVLEPNVIRGGILGWHKSGYLYTEGGPGNAESIPLLPDEVAHFAPIQDPLATYRGMSWMTPVLRQLNADRLMTRHKEKFFTNGATSNMVVKMPMLDIEKFKRFKTEMDSAHTGVDNAYKTMYLGGGADVSVVGSSFEQMTFADIEAAGEARIAAAAGVPPVVVGFRTGIEHSTYTNFSQARRQLADVTMFHLWENAAGSFSSIIRTPTQARLHFDTRDIPFLREDAGDAANIAAQQASTISTLVQAGYTAESVKKAVLSNDFMLLEHSGLFSVQLQEPGAEVQPANGAALKPKIPTVEKYVHKPGKKPPDPIKPSKNGKREFLDAY